MRECSSSRSGSSGDDGSEEQLCSLGLGVRFDFSEVPEPGTCWSGLRGPRDKESDTGKRQDAGLVLRELRSRS